MPLPVPFVAPFLGRLALMFVASAGLSYWLARLRNEDPDDYGPSGSPAEKPPGPTDGKPI